MDRQPGSTAGSGPACKPTGSTRARSRGQRRDAAGPVGRLRLTRRATVIGRSVFGIAAALVLIGAGLGWYVHDDVLGAMATSNALAGLSGSSGNGVNILLMGLDSRRDMDGGPLAPSVLAHLHAGSSSDVGGYNTNTLILLHVPADGSRAVALSIPRDDYVTLPDGLGQNKIKEAYGLAKAQAEDTAAASGTTDPGALEELGREAGRRAAIEAVEQLLGVPVDHFAEVNLVGFYDLAEAIGGVQVCLNHAVHDSYSGADFPAGVQTLNGSQALAFVRQRHGLANGDLDRTHRQQAFLASVAHKLETEGIFHDVSRLGGLIDVARKDVVVDSGFDVLAFLSQAQAVTSGDITFYTLPIKGYATIDGEAVNLIDPAQVRATAQRLLDGQPADTAQFAPDEPSGPEDSSSPSSQSSPSRPSSPSSIGVAAGSTRSAGTGPAIPQAQAEQGAVGGGSGLASSAANPAFTPPPGVPCVN